MLFNVEGAAKIEPSGSTPTMMQFGHFSFSFLERPVNVPPKKQTQIVHHHVSYAVNSPVPAPATTISTFPRQENNLFFDNLANIELTVACFENFFCCCIVVSNWIVRISILIQNVRIGYFHFQSMSHAYVRFG